MFAFNKDYLLKSMLGMISDEGKRILSLGLVDKPTLTALAEKSFDISFKSSGAVGLDGLASFHNKLKLIHLPGDFEKVVESMEITTESLWPGESREDLDDLRDKEDELMADEENTDVIEAILSDTDEGPIQEEDPDELRRVEDEHMMALSVTICDKLEKLAYGFGKIGNHEAAYMVERSIMSIRASDKTTERN